MLHLVANNLLDWLISLLLSHRGCHRCVGGAIYTHLLARWLRDCIRGGPLIASKASIFRVRADRAIRNPVVVQSLVSLVNCVIWYLAWLLLLLIALITLLRR